MVHIIKIYFTTSKKEVEIRRIAVSSDTVSNFHQLLEKIQNVFQLPNAENLSIKWKDPENDFILMSSNDELAQALANAEEGLLRLYVSLNGNPEQTSMPSTSREPHPYVVCDGCDKTIVGVRYKCLQCRNYDLCSSCDGANKHPLHDMIKFVKPTYIPREWVFVGARKLWKSMFNRCSNNYFAYFGDESEQAPNVENPANASTQCPMNTDSQANDNTVPKSVPTNSAGGASSPSGSQQAKEARSPNAGNTGPNHSPNFYDFAKLPGDFISVLQNDIADAPKVIHQGLNQALKVFQGAIENLDRAAYNPEFRRSQGNANKAAAPTNNTPTQTTPTFEKQSTSEPSPIIETISLDANENVNFVPDNNNSSASKAFQDELIIDLDTEGTPNAEEPAACPEGWTMLDGGDTNRMDCNNANGTQDTTECNAAEMECNGNTPRMENNGNTTPSTVVYPDVMEVEANQERSKDYIQTSDPVIISAVQTMQAMGFTNEGGWLERLIMSKQGNINDALEALYPSIHR